MKRCIVAISALILLLMFAVAPISGTTWHTNRDDIIITTGTEAGHADIDYTDWYNGTLNRSAVTSVNFTLPCNLKNLSQRGTNFTIFNLGTGADNLTWNLTVNGVLVNHTEIWCNISGENITYLADMVGAGVDNTSEYLNISFDSNQTETIIGFNITGTDVNFSATWITNAVITITERDITIPTVSEDGTSSSYFTVNNSMNLSNSTLWFSLTDVVLNVTFPSCAVTDSITNFTISTLAANGTNQQYTQYLKRGPYLKEVEDNSVGTSHSVDLFVQSGEVLTKSAIYEIDTSHSIYDGYLDTLDYDTLVVYYNDAESSWGEGSVNMEDLTLKSGWRTNKFTLTWTEVAPIEPAVEPVWWETSVLFLQVWIWIVLIVIILVILVAVVVSKD